MNYSDLKTQKSVKSLAVNAACAGMRMPWIHTFHVISLKAGSVGGSL